MQFQDEKFSRFLSRNLFSSYYKNFQSYLLRLLRFSRLRLVKKNRILLLYLQLTMANNLSKCYKAIQKEKNEVKIIKNRKNSEINKKSKAKLEKQLEEIQIRIFAHKNIARIIKTIVDGIAWRNLKFDRPILRLIASNRRTGYIDINEPGFRGVINIAKSIVWNKKRVVIINDISNFIRIGDVTEISKLEILIHESKAKGKKVRNIFSLLQVLKETSKISKQTKRLIKAQTAISYRKIFIDNGETVEIRDLMIPFKNYLKDVKKIILKAKKEGFFSKKISEYLVVSCLDTIQSVQLKRNGKIKDWTDFKTAENWDEKDFIFPFKNTDSFYKNEDFFIPNMTPYSVFPFPSKICSELLSGRLILKARLNISKVYSYFEENGWRVNRKSVDEFVKRVQKVASLYLDIDEAYHYDESLCILKRGNFNLAIPATLIFRIGMDFMAAETILLAVEEVFKQAVPFKKMISTMNFLNERRIWK